MISPNAPPLPSKSTLEESASNKLSHSPPPMYNMKYFEEKAIKNKNEKKMPQQDDDFDLGLPPVPTTHPDPLEPSNNSNSSNNNNVGTASIDYDELTKRFQNLKHFK